MKYDAIIVASGKGERAKLGYNKVFYKMKNGRTVLENSASNFVDDNDCNKIIIVTNKDNFEMVFSCEKVVVVSGGEQRKDSVYNGLKEVTSGYVLIHDAARPFLKKESLEELKKQVEKNNFAILAQKAIDTVKLVDNTIIEKTIDRNNIYLAQTPQGFKTEVLKECFEQSKDNNYTDDASLVESFGYKVYIVENKYDNKKLTTEMDFSNL